MSIQTEIAQMVLDSTTLSWAKKKEMLNHLNVDLKKKITIEVDCLDYAAKHWDKDDWLIVLLGIDKNGEANEKEHYRNAKDSVWSSKFSINLDSINVETEVVDID